MCYVMIHIYTYTANFGTTISDDNVRLDSTLLFKQFSYPGLEETFSCVTKGSVSVIWRSSVYIGAAEGDKVEFTSGDIGNP